MKRNVDLIRLLLLLEENDPAAKREFLEKYPRTDSNDYLVSHHVALLIDAGLVEGTISYDRFRTPVAYDMIRLTWAGHELLELIRNETIWEHAKEKVLRRDAPWSFAILLEVATAEARRQLGLS